MNIPSQQPADITLKIPLSRDVYKRVIHEAEMLGVSPGDLLNRMLRALFESGDLIPLNSLRFMAVWASIESQLRLRQTETLKSEE